MDNHVISPNYIGYLNDSLLIYKRMDMLLSTYEAAEDNYKTLTDAFIRRQNAFNGKNFVITSVLAFLPFLSVALILRALWPHLTLLFLVGSIILPVVSALIIKQMYDNFVFPGYEDKVSTELAKNRKAVDDIYATIIADKQTIQKLSSSLDSNCRYPLAVFIMLEFAKRGQDNNVVEGATSFLNKYESLSTSNDEESLELKRQIEKERESFDDKESFLNDIEVRYTDLCN